MWIRDNEDGEVRAYGLNHHDALVISADGRCLYYENLQNGDGSRGGGYSFVTDENGNIPIADESLMEYGAEGYANIGGFASDEIKEQNRRLRDDILRISFEKENWNAIMWRHGYEQAKEDMLEKFDAIMNDFAGKHPDYETTDDKYVIAVMATLGVCKEAVENLRKSPQGDTKDGGGV